MSRPPWMNPPEYNDDRFDDEGDEPPPDGDGPADLDDEGDDAFTSTDMSPIDYGRGPHDDEFGVDPDEFESLDTDPIDYGAGPHDDEFGVDDDDHEDVDA